MKTPPLATTANALKRPQYLHDDPALFVRQRNVKVGLITLVLLGFFLYNMFDDEGPYLSFIAMIESGQGEGFGVVVYFLIFAGLLTMLFYALHKMVYTDVPRDYRVQHFSPWAAIDYHFFWLVHFLLLAGAGLYAYHTFVVPELMRLIEAEVMWLQLTPYFVLIVYLLLFRLPAFGKNLAVFWRHVRVSAYFDKSRYQPGDRLELRIESRALARGEEEYQLYFNFVREGEIRKNSGFAAHRYLLHSESRACTSRQLQNGIILSLPNSDGNQSFSNILHTGYYYYWEVVLEDKVKKHWFRFLVDVA